VFGAVLMLLSGIVLIGFEALLARYEGSVATADLFGDQAAGAQQPKSDILGPLNILLVGIDPRDAQTRPLADSVIIAHIPAGLDRAYLFSLPRDLLVEIPAFSKAGYTGGTDKLNAAMSHGSNVPGKNPEAAQGFELLAKTITANTGIPRFDAGAIIDFGGFRKIVDAMGGVEMYIEREVRSEHRQPNGKHREPNQFGEGYVGPQAVYKKGKRHLEGWQALDYVRQRYPSNGVPDGDYGRQRHQQQFVKAMAAQALSRDVATNPIKLDAVLRAAGESLVFNGRGHSVADFGFALRGISSDSIQMIKLEGGGVGTGSNYQGEEFTQLSKDFLASVKNGTVDEFVIANPELLNQSR
jgi:LCP family protein required for cell wall assembly